MALFTRISSTTEILHATVLHEFTTNTDEARKPKAEAECGSGVVGEEAVSSPLPIS